MLSPTNPRRNNNFCQAARNTACIENSLCVAIRMARAVVHVHVRRGVVAVPVHRAGVRPVVPVAADTRRARHAVSLYIHFSFMGALQPPNPRLTAVRKARAEVHGHGRRGVGAVPVHRAGGRPVAPAAADTRRAQGAARIVVIIRIPR